MNTFAKRFKQLRLSSGFSQQALAEKLKISKSSVNMYERGEREPGFETLESIADFFNVDMNYLLGSEKNVLDPGGKFKKYTIPPQLSDKAVKIVTQIDSSLYERLCILADEDDRSFENEMEFLLYWAVEEEIERRTDEPSYY